MFAWLVLYVTIWQVVAGGRVHKIQPYDYVESDEDTHLLDTSNIEMLIPLVYSKQIETPRADPLSLEDQRLYNEINDEPFSKIPDEEFALDAQPVFAGEKSRSIKKDLSRDVDDYMPRSMYLQELYDNNRAKEEAANEVATARDVESEVMLYLCDELLDAFRHRNGAEDLMKALIECRENMHAVIHDGRPGAGAPAKGDEWRGSGSDGRVGLALFGPVGGRRDWMDLRGQYPGLLQQYIKTGRKPRRMKPF